MKIRTKGIITLLLFLHCLLMAQNMPAQQYKAVQPLLHTVWHQNEPFNLMTPLYHYTDADAGTPTKVGCIATAVSEVMNHYRWPDALADSIPGWSTAHYTLHTIPMGTPIRWELMRHEYHKGEYTNQEAQAVAQLALMVGMAAGMNYGVSASGAGISRISEALGKVFDYKYVQLHDRSRYSPGNWMKLLHEELMRGVPLVYVGSTFGMTSHAFVVDGINEQGLLHARWGEGGTKDGYFDSRWMNPYERVSDATPMGMLTGHSNNQCVIAFHPDSLERPQIDTLTYRNEEIEVTRVQWSHAPQVGGYNTMNTLVTNHSNDSIYLTMLALITDADETHPGPTADSIDWEHSQAAAFATVLLEPQCKDVTVPFHCQFFTTGKKYFAITVDGLHTCMQEPINVKEAGSALIFNAPHMEQVTHEEATCIITAHTATADDWRTELVTYNLAETHNRLESMSHYGLVTATPLQEGADTITFKGLKPGTDYTLQVRCPWTLQHELQFATPAQGALGLHDAMQERSHELCHIYNAQGTLVASVHEEACSHKLTSLPAGLYIVKKGTMVKKIIK